jgi:hypothetical protein
MVLAILSDGLHAFALYLQRDTGRDVKRSDPNLRNSQGVEEYLGTEASLLC